MTTILSRKVKLEKNIRRLSREQCKQIYRLLKENSYPATTNNNGVFFNLLPMKTELFTLIENFVNYSVLKNDLLEKEQKKIEQLKMLVHN